MENMFQSLNSTFHIVLKAFVLECDAHPLFDLDRQADRHKDAKAGTERKKERLGVSFLTSAHPGTDSSAVVRTQLEYGVKQQNTQHGFSKIGLMTGLGE